MNILRTTTLLLAGIAPIAASIAGTFALSDGTVYEGEVRKVFEGAAYLSVGDDSLSIPLEDFDAASREMVLAWVDENPQAVDVHTKWDVQPRLKSSAMPQLPEVLHTPDFKGMVSVDLVLNESGQVIHASIKKSTHAELETPSLEAAKTWIFEPAKIGGRTVKSKLRVPFKFTYTPPAAEETPAS